MSKTAGLILTVLGTGLLIGISGCGMIREYYQMYTDDMSTGLREPTGWYDHTEVKENRAELVIPDGMQDPAQDANSVIPDLPPGAENAAVGETVDIRAPVAPLRSDLGLRSQWVNGEALVWFEPGGRHGITDEASAWNLLNSTLGTMQVPVGKVTPDAYEMTTAGSDFNEFGGPYTPNDMAHYALRYHQVYRIRLGRGPDGSLGVATSLIGSMTMLSGGHLIENLLDNIELERFSMGFSNHFIHQLEENEKQRNMIPDMLNVSLGRDRNAQECYLVDAPYEVIWTLLRQMLPKYSWEITEYSSSAGRIKVTVDEEDAAFFHARGVDSFALPDGEYVLRVGVEQGRTAITIYDKDDKPLSPGTVERIYSGFAQAMAKEYPDVARAARESAADAPVKTLSTHAPM